MHLLLGYAEDPAAPACGIKWKDVKEPKELKKKWAYE